MTPHFRAKENDIANKRKMIEGQIISANLKTFKSFRCHTFQKDRT